MLNNLDMFTNKQLLDELAARGVIVDGAFIPRDYPVLKKCVYCNRSGYNCNKCAIGLSLEGGDDG